MTVPDLATRRQIDAANPAASTWLSANAGSGKTKVLTDRVARLLLGGTEPQKVLCLTYTKAAASEMQNRLLKRLGAWAMLEDDALRAELTRLGEAGPVTDALLAQARRLFAQAIEAPGGLKIQTIHSFCGTLLRRFPLEAGVPHGFAELDDRSAEEMRREILEEIAVSPERSTLDRLSDFFTGDDLTGIIAGISKNSDVFTKNTTRADLLSALGLPPGFAAADVLRIACDGSERALLAAVVPILKQQSKTMQDLAGMLATLDPAAPDLPVLYDAFLLKKDWTPKIKSVPTKNAVKAMGEDLTDAFHAFMERVAAARDAESALRTVDRSLALADFARAFLPRYRKRKADGGWLDFDDLIARAGALLSNGSVAQWVLFRLDGGIDHILVDEAQDTSPGQWAVIERLADEFTAGEGARDAARTIFVVGDRKQSIYSFQGADLHRFEAMQSLFSDKFAAIERPLQRSDLLHSFRSSPAVLRVVDQTFAGAGAVGLGGVPEHVAFHDSLPGRVDLWPPVAAPEDKETGAWENPVDLPGRQDATVILARTIAAEIAAMIRTGTRIPDGNGARPVHEGDFLILVQRRSTLFGEVIRACKAAGLAVAGADRLRLGAEIAVRDIVSVLAFLATPEDDLSLAEALRSPIFGWSEQALYDLAQPRKGYLWAALRDGAGNEETLAVLRDLRNQTDFLRPFDLIERLLNRHGARERLIARLGPEAEDGIDELIAQALAYEGTEIPSLTGFLGWLGADEIEVKRQLENEGRMIRVMTVHGAKGLEAPIVILPDTAKPRPPRTAEMLRAENGTILWKGGDPPAALGRLQEAEAARASEERMRLLYVALTRAEKWLIVAAAGETGTGEESWYALVGEAMARLDTRPAEALSQPARDLGPVLRHQAGDWPAPGAAEATATAQPIVVPDWARMRAATPARPEGTLSPSDLGGAKALPGEIALPLDDSGLRHGRLLHLLLEHLPGTPRESWPDRARDLLTNGPDRADEAEALAMLAAALPALQTLDAAGLTGPEALAEVEITAALPELGGQRIHGTLDRVLVTPDHVHLVDYKSNAIVPAQPGDVPPGLLRQMAAYRAALRQIWPGRRLTCSLLWTRTGALMPLPDGLLDTAFADGEGAP